MRAATTIALLFSTTLGATAHPSSIDSEIPSIFPRELAEVMSTDALLVPRDDAVCLRACIAGFGTCSSQGCLANCQIGW